MKKIKRFAGLVMALLFILLLSWAGNADYEEAVRQERQYIDDVCFGFQTRLEGSTGNMQGGLKFMTHPENNSLSAGLQRADG
jgi:hypothetical protein